MKALDYSQILALHQEIAPLIEGELFLEIEDAGIRKFILKFSSYSIFFSFQDPLLYFHLTAKKGHGGSSSFSKKINELLRASHLKKFEILNEDRILKFSFKKNETLFFLIACFFPKKPNFYLTDDKMQILSSLNCFLKTELSFCEKKKSTHTLCTATSQSIAAFYQKSEVLLAFQKKKTAVKSTLQRETKRLLKARENFEESLKKALLFKEKQHQGELLKANFQKLKKGMDFLTVIDWEEQAEVKIPLDPLLDPKDQIADFFKKAKKLKTSILHLNEQINKINQKLTSVLKELERLELLTTLKELESQYPVKVKVDQEKFLPYREFISETGFKILVGKNSRCNDTLTFQYAKGNDLWLHVKDYPGSHVVIVRKKGQQVDQTTIERAVSLACFYSKAKDNAHVEVCLTERKYVSRLGKKKDGKVQISKQKILNKKFNKHNKNTL